ncbi:MAG: MBOAT family protein [Bacteroidia bacterium]
MLFNSIEFLIFFPIVFFLYWVAFRNSIKIQNAFILLASYVFYGWWDWRFLFLIAFSSLADYFIGKKLMNVSEHRKRKLLLLLSLGINLGVLGTFKYYNFFLDNFVDAFEFFGQKLDVNRLDIILPVGISFYTFQTLSYTIDIYRRKINATKDILSFAAFVSFFPQLVAGPIERASNLLPQFKKRRTLSYEQGADGLRQILWGLFKKVVIADNAAVFVNDIFSNYETMPASALFIGALLFSFQIYGDFSGYSDIAIGSARLLGFNLMKNFAFPYFSRDIAEFWRRWHISLSTWFRDYVYIPLGGSRVARKTAIRNVFIIFIVSGFWHGANWTFIVWGLLNALYFLPLMLTNRNRKNLSSIKFKSLVASTREFLSILGTFGLTTFAWIFFRADSITHAILYIKGLWSPSLFQDPSIKNIGLYWFLLLIFLVTEWIGRHGEHALDQLANRGNRVIRWSIYLIIIMLISLYKAKSQDFIYFQF